jgi:hypothetical protein
VDRVTVAVAEILQPLDVLAVVVVAPVVVVVMQVHHNQVEEGQEH